MSHGTIVTSPTIVQRTRRIPPVPRQDRTECSAETKRKKIDLNSKTNYLYQDKIINNAPHHQNVRKPTRLMPGRPRYAQSIMYFTQFYSHFN